MRIFANIKNRLSSTKAEGRTLAFGGIPSAPVTAEPDEAEQAASALLENGEDGGTARNNQPKQQKAQKDTPDYYIKLSERIRESRAIAARIATRYVAYTEQQLALTTLASVVAGDGALAGLEQGLYKHIDTVNLEGGKLKNRWQHCLAQITIKQMTAIQSTIDI